MAISIVGTGSQACTADGTVHTLDTETVAGIYVGSWNLTTSVKGDIFRCWIETKVLTGDTAETVFEGVYANDLLSNCIIQSPPVVSNFQLIMKISQTAGTSRTIPWTLTLIAT